jgi:hypothetical protein
MECPLNQNENFKVKGKGHNFFQIYTFLDSDFSTLIEYRNNLKFSQDFFAKSLSKLSCLKPREISIIVIPLKTYPVVTSYCFLFYGDNDNHTIFFLCVQNGWAGGHWSPLRKVYGRNHDLVDRYGIYVSQMTTDMFHKS